jgi:glycosyltransferase involved in cell wall biosynthesis
MSVVIPAHNESAVIERVLRPLMDAARTGEFEVIVAANGCTDGTADLVRALGPGISVLEIPTPSKVMALNAADQVATALPRAYVDADVDVDPDVLRCLADLLDRPDGPLVAAPRMQVDTSKSSWPVRAHYRVWDLTDYRQRGHVGSGIYALSAEGRQRFGAFPDIIADDRFVQQLFTQDERGTSEHGYFTVRAPATLRAFIRRSVRSAAGNVQLRTCGAEARAADVPVRSGLSALVPKVVRRPPLWPAFPVYCLAYVAPRLLARRKIAMGRLTVWERDETSRR